MELLKKLLEQFEDEIEGVEEYSKCTQANSDDPELAKMYKDMAAAELQHASSLKAQILKRGEKSIDPEEAKTIVEKLWEEKKADVLEKLAEANAYIGMVR